MSELVRIVTAGPRDGTTGKCSCGKEVSLVCMYTNGQFSSTILADGTEVLGNSRNGVFCKHCKPDWFDKTWEEVETASRNETDFWMKVNFEGE